MANWFHRKYGERHEIYFRMDPTEPTDSNDAVSATKTSEG